MSPVASKINFIHPNRTPVSQKQPEGWRFEDLELITRLLSCLPGNFEAVHPSGAIGNEVVSLNDFVGTFIGRYGASSLWQGTVPSEFRLLEPLRDWWPTGSKGAR